MTSFRRGRDFSAWLRLVPRQHFTGGKPQLANRMARIAWTLMTKKQSKKNWRWPSEWRAWYREECKQVGGRVRENGRRDGSGNTRYEERTAKLAGSIRTRSSHLNTGPQQV